MGLLTRLRSFFGGNAARGVVQMNRYIFHLSIPVQDLMSAKRFYVEVLGAAVGRETEDWLDILLWGHQITLQRGPWDSRSESMDARMQPGGRDLEIPLEPGRVTWRLVSGLVLAGICLVEVVSVVGSSHPHASDSTAVVLFIFGTPAGSLLLSGVAIHSRWRPNLLFRVLPAIVCVGLGILGLCFALFRA
jgi:hypothetical protein